jgi:alpha-L-fucosidase 2
MNPYQYVLFCACAMSVLIQGLFAAEARGAARPDDLRLWYDRPAARWQQEALPIGNAFMGAMLFGGMREERIQFNEESLWIGDEEDTGSYQAFGDVFVKLDGHPSTPGPEHRYRRELDLARALHVVTYEHAGVRHRREAFASYPARVVIVRYTADKPGSLSGTIHLTDSHQAPVSAAKNRLSVAGSLDGFVYQGGTSNLKPGDRYKLHLLYESQLAVSHAGGVLEAVEDRLVFKNADSLTLVLGAGTDFVQDRTKGWKGEHPHAKVTARVDAALRRTWEHLLDEHTRDHQTLFHRVTLDLGGSNASSLPTDQRIETLRKTGAPDPGLEELLFQFGRYLLIASSRPGSLPANLQGKWNDSNNPPWRGDYHTDINLQMNYWPADVANLSECFQPYTDWIHSIRAVRTEATLRDWKKPGWIIRGESGLFGGSTWKWIPGASAWLLQNSYDHYRFTRDLDYLRTRAYPAMKEVCAFWIASLETLPDGTLVTAEGFSPEHGPKERGISFDQQMVWDLFTNTIEAADVLRIDKEFRDQLEAMRVRLLPPKIGKWGQLQEWMVDRDDPKNTHRHVSHLVALFPGRQISSMKTPELAQAARISLNARGDRSTGWSMANKINLWARLHDGDRAHKLGQDLLITCIMNNLLGTHPPFQIDGNFGYTAGVCEMLLQSHLDEIHLLPALPKAWSSGSFTGLKARGGFIVDAAWRDGKITSYRITAPTPRPVNVRVNGAVETHAATTQP